MKKLLTDIEGISLLRNYGYRLFNLIKKLNLNSVDIVITLSFIAFGILCVVIGNRYVRLAKESVNWPDIQGKIVESRVTENRDVDSSITTYSPYIKYSFKVNGKTYVNDTITYRGQNTDKEWAENFISDYPEDHSVTVYFNPEDPELSVLEKGIDSSNYGVIYFGYLWIILSLAYFAGRSIWGIFASIPLQR